MCKRKFEEAVSESIGFIIIFGLIITGIGLVTLYGYPELLQNQISADDRNMEQNMIILQNDVKLLCYGNIPYKDTALRVSGGSLTVFDNNAVDSPQYFNITYYQQPVGGNTTGIDFYPGEMRYNSEQGSAVISLENGAVVQRQELVSGSFMTAEPRWFYDNESEAFVIFLIGIDTGGEMLSLNGIGNIQMSRLDEPDVIDIDYSPNKRDVIVKYAKNSANDYSTAWDNYFNSSSIVNGGLTPSGGAFVLEDVSRIVIKQYNITIMGI
jgi:hypothetical protein